MKLTMFCLTISQPYTQAATVAWAPTDIEMEIEPLTVGATSIIVGEQAKMRMKFQKTDFTDLFT